MPQSNKRLPKIDHAGRPVNRSYRALGAPLATPIPCQPEPLRTNRQRQPEGAYAAAVAGVTSDYAPQPHSVYP